ncbi:MAG: ABC transporter substrate-binding protein [Candidatus Acidiferrales bacterium]
MVVALALPALAAAMARRPHYGGTLRVEIGAAVSSLEPSENPGTPEEIAVRNQIDALIYESRDADGEFSGAQGSGPFRISDWQPGKELALTANEKFSGGRPYVDGIEITMNRAARDRLLDLELNKTDFAEIAAQDARHAAERGVRVSTSQPDELVALIFARGARYKTTQPLREAVSDSIDRSAIANFILQKTGEPATGLLPQWSSGTEFLFASPATPAEGISRAKELLGQITAIPKLVLGYDSADPLAQAIAERIAVNAKEAGIAISTLGLPAGGVSRAAELAQIDAVVERLRMSSAKPADALNGFLESAAAITDVESAPLAAKASAQDVLDRERGVMKTYWIVPLEWIPQVYGLSARVRDWNAPGPGETWPFADVWLEPTTPGAAQ